MNQSTTHALKSARDQEAVVGIQPHHIGHGAQGDQVTQGVQSRATISGIHASLAQLGPQGQHEIKNDADTCQVLGGKPAAWLVRIHNGQGVRQGVSRQMVICYHHTDAMGIGCCHALNAGDAVVDSDQEVWLAFRMS